MRNTLLTLFVVLGLAACAEPGAPPADEPDAPVQMISETRPAIVHLFEWRWDDVADECETFLGPNGYAAVQVSPVLENSLVEGRPWWEKYQPASYQIGNRSGDRDAFASMIQRCNAAGVQIYVDIILNHMTGVYEGVGVQGSTFGEYEYPGIYTYDDFHHCGLTEGDEIEVWDDPVQVQTCELVNLSDLDTGSEKVRAQLVTHLQELLSLGVTGFRLDTARHIAPEDVQAIFDATGGDPFIYQEVIDPNPPEWSQWYYPMGHVTEFTYSSVVSDVFFNGPLTRLQGDGSIWETVSFLNSDSALVFINNHDNQRGHGGGGHVVTFQDGALHDMATAFMLAYPFGTPRVMSSYAFETDRQGPPTEPGTETVARVHRDGGVDCGQGQWVCEHRQPTIAGMVGFNNHVTDADAVANWWSGGENRMAFARGDKGFVAFNRTDAAMTETLQTGLPAGDYCNLTTEGCTAVTVGTDGMASLEVPPMGVVALGIWGQP